MTQARKLEATTADNLEIQNFIAHRLWALGLQDEAAEVRERGFRRTQAHIPKGDSARLPRMKWTTAPSYAGRMAPC